MAQSRAEIQKRSDEKRGVRPKAYYLTEEAIAQIDRIAAATGKAKGALLAEMAAEYAQRHGI